MATFGLCLLHGGKYDGKEVRILGCLSVGAITANIGAMQEGLNQVWEFTSPFNHSEKCG